MFNEQSPKKKKRTLHFKTEKRAKEEDLTEQRDGHDDRLSSDVKNELRSSILVKKDLTNNK